MIPRTSINKLKDYLRRSSSTLGSPDFIELLEVSAPKDSSGDVVFVRLIKLALNEFERLNPAYLYGTISQGISSGDYIMFTNTFGDYLAGTINAEQIQLVPTAIVNISSSWVNQYRDYVYTAPYLSLGTIPSNGEIYYAARRPVIVSYEEGTKEVTDDSFIYFIDVDQQYKDRIFLKFLEYEILTYLRDQKNNLMYPDMPIDYISGLPERIAELQQAIDAYKTSPIRSAELLR